ncbi:hypothetical protein D3C72_2130090 [compost metagenome]
MAKTIVHLFKIIDIDKHQRRFATVMLELFKLFFDTFFQQASVSNVQQRIHHRDPFKLTRFDTQADSNAVGQHAQGNNIDGN